MSIENLIEKFDGLATVTVGILVTKMLVEYFKKKLNHEADKEDNINAILTKQLETLVENSVNYKNDINDLKRLILNKSNMSIPDFSIYLKNLNEYIFYKLTFEFYDIIEKNNIVENNLEVTIQKVNNIIEKVFSSASYEMYSLSFDRTVIEDLIKILRSEQKALKEKLETIITNYVQNKNTNLTHEEISNDTKKNIKELLTFTSIDLSTNIYNVLNGLNIYEAR